MYKVRKKTLVAFGFRDFPDIPGGIERHVEHIYSTIASKDWRIVCICRKRFKSTSRFLPHIEKRYLYAPRTAGLETFLHSLLSTVFCLWVRPNVVHIHGIGPGLFSVVLWLFRIKVVLTHHGFDYKREKWGRIAKWSLKISEFISLKFSDAVICVSNEIGQIVEARCQGRYFYVPNGIKQSGFCLETNKRRKVVLAAGRFVKEKRLNDITSAFMTVEAPEWQLIVAGSSTQGTDVQRLLDSHAILDTRIKLIGQCTTAEMDLQFRTASIFVNASAHEGLPLVVLEALANHTPVLLSDIPAHREFGMNSEIYFPVGDVKALAKLLSIWTENEDKRVAFERHIGGRKFTTWEEVGTKTFEIIRAISSY